MLNRLIELIKEFKNNSTWKKIFASAAAITVFVTTYMLILPALTLETTLVCDKPEHTHVESCYTSKKELVCGKEESEGHSHSDACYSTEKHLVCGQNESEGHSHSDACYDAEGNLICEKAESAGHSHSDSCYETEKKLICGKEESEGHSHSDSCYKEKKELTCKVAEHKHTDSCYEQVKAQNESDPKADIESKGDWEKSVNGVTLVSDWSKNMVNIAKSQLGYKESTKNFEVDDKNNKKGYTRYGQWYGDPYGDWSAMFVSFCAQYAGVGKYFPSDNDCARMAKTFKDIKLYHSADSDYVYKPGDILFVNTDNKGLQAGVIAYVGEGKIITIEGDHDNTVAKVEYKVGSSKISGYGELPKNPAVKDEETATTEAEVTTEVAEATTETDATTEIEEATTEAEATTEVEEATTEVEEATTEEKVEATTETEATTGVEQVITDAVAESELGVSEEIVSEKKTNILAKMFKGVSFLSAANAVDLNSHITNISVDTRPNNQGAWTAADKDSSGRYLVSQSDALRFNINFTVPKGTLGGDVDSIKFQAPQGLIFADSSGAVMHRMEQIGTYTISTNGEIIITYFKKYVDGNAKSDIIGDISFHSDVAHVVDSDKVNGNVPLSDSITLDFHITDRTFISDDYKVTKVATDIEGDYIYYEATVTSTNGTSGNNVTVQDVMTNAALDGSVTITKNGSQVTPLSGNPNSGTKNMTLTLPPMNAGETYTIVYRAKLDDGFDNKKANVSNQFDSSYTDGDERTYTGSVKVYNEVDKTHIKKSGTKLEDGRIQWTIEINAAHENIAGYKLKDDMLAGLSESDITVQTNNQNAETSQYNYDSSSGEITFNAVNNGQNTNSYKVIYTATYDENDVVDGKVKNVGVLEGGGKNPSSDAEVSVGGGQPVGPDEPAKHNPIAKTSNGYTKEQDGSFVLDWNLTIHPVDESLVHPWNFIDWTDSSDTYYTAEQLKEIVAQFRNAGYEVSIVAYAAKWALDQNNGPYDITDSSTGGQYKAFKVTCNNKTIEKDSTVSINYHSTVPKANTDKTLDIWNDANWPGHDNVYAGFQKTYVPVIRKTDATGGNNSGNHMLQDLDSQHTLKWKLELNAPEGSTGRMTIVDTLPDGVEFVRVTSADVNSSDYTVTTNGNAVTITISDASKVANQTKNFVVEAKIIDELSVGQVKQYANTVVVKDNGDNQIGSGSNTQTVENKDERVTLAKSASQTGPFLSYSVNINPVKVVTENNPNYQIEDQLTYTHADYTSGLRVTLVPNSVALYYQDTNEPVSTDLYTYVYKEFDDGGWCTDKLMFEMKTDRPIRLEYRYFVSGDTASTQNVKNKITLLGGENSKDETEINTPSQIQESEAHSSLNEIILYKVDANNTGLVLPGAKFEVYKYYADTNEYRLAVNPVTKDPYRVTDERGMINLDSLTPNQAYYLLEAEAPEGYMIDPTPFYFYIDGGTNWPRVIPEGFNGTVLHNGDIRYIPNRKAATSKISVTKQWFNSNNENITDRMSDRSIAFKIWRLEEEIQHGGGDTPTPSGNTYTVNVKGGHYGLDSLILNNTYTLPEGSKILLTVESSKSDGMPNVRWFDETQNGNMNSNYTDIDPVRIIGITSPKTYLYEIPVTRNMTIGVHTGDNNGLVSSTYQIIGSGNISNNSDSTNSNTPSNMTLEQAKNAGAREVASGIISEADNWNWSRDFTVNPNMNYTYYVEEINTGDYDRVEYSGQGTGDFVIKNTVTEEKNPEYIDLTFDKKWKNASNEIITNANELSSKPEVTLEVHQVRDGDSTTDTVVRTITLNNDNWSQQISGLISKDYDNNGTARTYSYYVVESMIGDEPAGEQNGYGTTYLSSNSVTNTDPSAVTMATTGSITVTNKEIEKTSVSVQKVWAGTSETQSVTLQLKQGASNYGEPVILASSPWNYTWINLPKNDEYGNPYEYTVTESALSGYNVPIVTKDQDYVKLPYGTALDSGKKYVFVEKGTKKAVAAQGDSTIITSDVTIDNDILKAASDTQLWELTKNNNNNWYVLSTKYLKCDGKNQFVTGSKESGRGDTGILALEDGYCFYKNGVYFDGTNKAGVEAVESAKRYDAYLYIGEDPIVEDSSDGNLAEPEFKYVVTNIKPGTPDVPKSRVEVNKQWFKDDRENQSKTGWIKFDVYRKEVSGENPSTEQPSTETPSTEAPSTEEPSTEVPVHTHSYSSAVTTPATCESAGVRTYTCTDPNCNDSYTESIPAIGHSWGDWEIVTEATSTTAGSKRRVCQNDSSHIDTQTIPATGGGSTTTYTVKIGLGNYAGATPNTFLDERTVNAGDTITVEFTSTQSSSVFTGWNNQRSEDNYSHWKQDVLTNEITGTSSEDMGGWSRTIYQYKVEFKPTEDSVLIIGGNDIVLLQETARSNASYQSGAKIAMRSVARSGLNDGALPNYLNGATKLNDQPITITDANNWKWSHEYDAELDKTYVYYVVEVDSSSNNCEVDYENQGSSNITIKNTETTETFELPHTGSTGTKPYTMGGLIAMIGAALALMYKRKKSQRGTA